MNPEKQLATEITEHTEKTPPLNTASIVFIYHMNRDSLPLCVLCGLN